MRRQGSDLQDFMQTQRREAAAEYERALVLTESEAERRFLRRRLAETTARSGH